jgi:hypothetical protein
MEGRYSIFPRPPKTKMSSVLKSIWHPVENSVILQNIMPDQRAYYKKGHLDSLEESTCWGLKLPEMGQLLCNAVSSPMLKSLTQSWGQGEWGTVNLGSEEQLPCRSAQGSSLSPLGSSHRPPVPLPKKYQPLPLEPPESITSCPQRQIVPEALTGTRWETCHCHWWNDRGVVGGGGAWGKEAKGVPSLKDLHGVAGLIILEGK